MLGGNNFVRIGGQEGAMGGNRAGPQMADIQSML